MKDLFGNDIVIPPKCKHCGRDKGNHKARGSNCPFGSPKYTRTWPTNYYPNQVYEPKEKKARKKNPKV